MQKLAEICVRRPVFATVIILVLVVFGTLSYSRLGVDRFPKIDFPTITVTAKLPGAAPEEMETEVADKIEEAVNTISGIDELRSTSVEGVSQVFITFVLEKNPDVAAQEVRDRIDRILSQLPEDIENPRVEKLDTDSAPVVVVAVSSNSPVSEITEWADKNLRRRLETVSGVGQVTLAGGRGREITIRLDPLRLKAQQLTVTEVARALQTNNLQIPGGSLRQGDKELTLRTLGRVDRVEDLGLIPIAVKNGHTVRVADVASVEDSQQDVASLAGVDDKDAVLLIIQKQSGSNTVEVVQTLRDRVAELSKSAPPGYSVRIVRDSAVFVETGIHNVQEHLVLGSIFAAIVVMLFLGRFRYSSRRNTSVLATIVITAAVHFFVHKLHPFLLLSIATVTLGAAYDRNFRATLIAAIAIPASIISTFAAINYMGYTLNFITLLALTLSVGIVIDDAIVVLENIYRWIEEKGLSPFDAAIEATREIGLAVVAITLSLVAVFLPVAFMTGIVGRFMSSFGVTMSFAIIVSMLVSFTLTPMLCSRWLKRKDEIEAEDEDDNPAATDHHHHHAHKVSGGFYGYLIERPYMALLRFSLRFRWMVAVVCIAALASTFVLFGMVGKNFLPEDDQSEFEVSVKMPEGTSLEETGGVIKRIGRELRVLNGVQYTQYRVAGGDQNLSNQGRVYVRMTEPETRNFSQLALMQYIRQNIVPKYKALGIRVGVAPTQAISGGGNANAQVQFVIGGPDTERLKDVANNLMEALKKVPAAVDLDTNAETGRPEVGVVIDRQKAADLGVSVKDIADALRLLVAGDKVSDFNDGGEQYEVRLRAEELSRNNPRLLEVVSVPSTKAGTVALADVVKFRDGTGAATINRLNRQRQVTLLCNVKPGASQSEVIKAIDDTMKTQNLPLGYQAFYVGQSKELKRATLAFVIVFATAFLFMYLVIAAQFESWIHPATILFCLPLSLPFALGSLILFKDSLNIYSVLGLLVLFAVVKKNSILQVDHTNQLRAAGMPRNEAVLAANRDRLRPILMTTVAFVAGMIPLLLSTGAGSGTYRTISSLIVGGQIMSLLLTLIATPVLYTYLDDLSRFGAWLWGKVRRHPANPPAALGQSAAAH